MSRLHHAALAAFVLLPSFAFAQSDAELAKQLANPVASLVSVPFQYNYNTNIGPEDGSQSYINFQPVIPFALNDQWNLISRTIVPLMSQHDVAPVLDDQFGFGNTTQSFFFSPNGGDFTWGVGPAFLIPTATDHLGPNQWGAGVTGVVLKQKGPWTIGGLGNHIWSITGDAEDGDISQTFLQPFLNYTTPTATSYFVNTESTYDWEASEWSVPINVGVSQLFSVRGQKMQIGAGVRYWAAAPDSGPEGWGARLTYTLLFPH